MDEPTKWAVKQLKELADKLERGSALVTGIETPARLVGVTPSETEASQHAFSGEHSLTIYYEDADKPTFIQRT